MTGKKLSQCIEIRGVARNLLWGTNQRVWGTEVPQWGPGAEPRWGLQGGGAKPPEAGDKCG